MAADTSYSSPRTTQVLPRLGTSKTLGERWTAFAQVSTGFSDPTNFESRRQTMPDGSPPCWMRSARTLEVGARHTLGEVVVYHQQVQRAIVQDVDSNGAQIFVNTNAPITMQGVEWQVGNLWRRHRDPCLGLGPIPPLERRRLARFPEVDGQPPTPLDRLGPRPHVDLAVLGTRSRRDALEQRQQCGAPRIHHSECRVGLDAAFKSGHSFFWRAQRHQHDLFGVAPAQWVWG